MYVTAEEYRARYPGESPDEELTSVLSRAEDEIDALTFNRIRAAGFSALTTFQQRIVKNAVCDQAHFREEYGELLDQPLASYGINGVSMSFDRNRILTVSGVTTTPEILSLLRQSGLTYRGLAR